MSTVERIKQYLDYKGISKYRFYQETGMANGALDKGGNMGSDKCEIISYQYPELSIEWLITGRGEMLKSDELVAPINKDMESFYQKIIANKDETIATLNRQIGRYEEATARFREEEDEPTISEIIAASAIFGEYDTDEEMPELPSVQKSPHKRGGDELSAKK